MEKRDSYRRLSYPPPKPRPLDARFWWLAGITLAVVFLACVAMAYAAHGAKYT